MATLEQEFEKQIWATHEEVKRLLKVKASRYLQLLGEHGPVGAAKHILDTGTSDVQSGLTDLFLNKRLDLSIEYMVLIPKYRSLFSEEQRDTARRRLSAYGLEVNAD
jgi:hypothetical protein